MEKAANALQTFCFYVFKLVISPELFEDFKINQINKGNSRNHNRNLRNHALSKLFVYTV